MCECGHGNDGEELIKPATMRWNIFAVQGQQGNQNKRFFLFGFFWFFLVFFAPPPLHFIWVQATHGVFGESVYLLVIELSSFFFKFKIGEKK